MAINKISDSVFTVKFQMLVLFFVCSLLFSNQGWTRERLVLTGSSTVAPLIAEMARRFENLNPNVRIDVQMGGSSRGVADAQSGIADIGMVSRDLKPEEKGLFVHTIAMDGVAMIINSANPISGLDRQQILAIYQGRVDNWNQVGGPNHEITVVNKAEGHSTLELFLHYFKLKNSQIKADSIIGDNQQGIKLVAGNPYAIGYVSVGAAEYEAKNGAPLKLLPMEGVTASVEQVQQGHFPLSRPLNLVTKNRPDGLIKRFIHFVKARKQFDIVREQYFVPFEPLSSTIATAK